MIELAKQWAVCLVLNNFGFRQWGNEASRKRFGMKSDRYIPSHISV